MNRDRSCLAGLQGRVGVVVLTFNRCEELLRTLARLLSDPDFPGICVIDNGSSDGTTQAVSRHFPGVQLIGLPSNEGAAGRNHGVRALATPYVAFCDDDTWWAPGSLARAVRLLDRHPRIGALTARILVGPEEREDPVSGEMARSPLRRAGHDSTLVPVAGLMAGASIMRRPAFLAAGGYEPRLFLGGEERLLALDMMAAGWQLAYAPELVVHHHPSPRRDHPARRHLLLRNALWCAWLRRPFGSALRESLAHLRTVLHHPALAGAVADAVRGLPWVLRRRRVIPPHVESRLRVLEAARP